MAFYPAHCDDNCKGCEKNYCGWCIWNDKATEFYKTEAFNSSYKTETLNSSYKTEALNSSYKTEALNASETYEKLYVLSDSEWQKPDENMLQLFDDSFWKVR